MLDLSQELLDHLECGGTLLVPSRQRAAALRLAHSAAQLRAGRDVWRSADVLPWSAWLERGLDAARARGLSVPRRLSGAEEWLLWRDAVREACADLPVLDPDALIDSARRAVALLDDYGLEPQVADSPESVLLLQTRAHVRRRCAQWGALRSTSWRDCEPYLDVETATHSAGFGALGGARGAWLERVGVRPPAAGGSLAKSVERCLAFADAEREAQAAAQWCAGRLRAEPQARLLLIVPDLQQRRHSWVRALSQCLDYPTVLEPRLALHDSMFAIEGGQPLADYPLVACALHLVALGCGQGNFLSLSAVLRSPFIGSRGRDSRLQIELWLRQHNVGAAQLPPLASLLAPLTRDLGEGAAATWRELSTALEALGQRDADASAAARWAQRFAALLSSCGWPGDALCSAEQQVRMRFDELLGDVAAAALTSNLPRVQTADLLRQLAARTAFEPASDDVPVTLSASFDDPIVRYDGIWVAGLSAQNWPQPARADPLIPAALQYAMGMPMASPAGQLHCAEEALGHWRQRSSQLILSCALIDGDLPLDPSPLLDRLEVAPEPEQFMLSSWIAARAPLLEAWSDAQGPAWPSQRVLRGGTRLLEQQSLCPFRGFAEQRLRAQPLPEPAPGIDRRLRGQILHRALELFWRAMDGSAALRERTPESRLALARDSIARALAQAEARVPGSLEPVLLRREGARTELLLRELIEWELAREPFEIRHLEWPQDWEIGGGTLSLRLDRVDRLADGSLLVIDYKSGAAHAFDAEAARPLQPQLLAYAMATGEQTAAVVALHCGREGLKLRGIADRTGRLPRLRSAVQSEMEWQPLLARWHTQLQELVQEFLRGDAAVQPQPRACERCHLQALCRVDPELAASP